MIPQSKQVENKNDNETTKQQQDQQHERNKSTKRPPSTQNVTDSRPMKRLRTWCDVVEKLSLQNGVETDDHRLAQRQKQIDYGKNTIAYDKFIAARPRHMRKHGDPMTPLVHQKCSKRSFVGQVISWRKKVYSYADKIDNKNGKSDDKNKEKPSPPSSSDRTSTGSDRGLDDSEVHDDDDGDEENGDEGLGRMAGMDMMDVDFLNDSEGIDDIQLDDQGNVITSDKPSDKDDTDQVQEKTNEEDLTVVKKDGNASIFDSL